MKKLISIIMATVLCLSLTACSQPQVEQAPATDGEKQTVTDTIVNYVTGDEFKAHAQLYKDSFGEEPAAPQLNAAYTFKCDVEGFAMDLLMLNISADIAVDHNGEIYGYEKFQVLIDNNSGTVYNSAEYMAKLDSFDGVINSEETAAMMLLCSSVLIEGGDDYIWSETEESSKFTDADIKEINAAIAQ